MDDTLNRFIHEALAKGIERVEVEETLLAAKWPQDEVAAALDAYADIDFAIPVPKPRQYISAREVFLYLILFTFLYFSAWHYGSLLFGFIDRAFPDAVRHSTWDGALRTIRWSVATLLIAFPGYLVLSRRFHIVARRDPEKRKSKARKWLTHLTLFLAASTLVGDLITLLYNLLEGELTTPFILRVLVVGVIAGSILGYYLWDLRQDELRPEDIPTKHPGLRGLVAAVTLAVMVGVIAGLFVAGSPGRVRTAKLDDQRESNLSLIAMTIDRYWNEFKELPADLSALEHTRGYTLPSTRDPETGHAYEYSPADEKSYELCAVFEAVSNDRPERRGPYYRGVAADSKFWEHGVGRTCFSIEVTDRSR